MANPLNTGLMKKHSNKNTFSDSQENRYTRKHIEDRIRMAKKQKIDQMINKYSYVFCEDCKISAGIYLDCSHNVSVDKALKSGKCELAWNIDNIKIRCRECHKKHDKS